MVKTLLIIIMLLNTYFKVINPALCRYMLTNSFQIDIYSRIKQITGQLKLKIVELKNLKITGQKSGHKTYQYNLISRISNYIDTDQGYFYKKCRK